KATLAVAACGAPVLFGFVAPAAVLGAWAVEALPGLDSRFFEHALNSFLLASAAAMAAVLAALVMAYGQRLHPDRVTLSAVRVASLGYAVPGSVIAVGVMVPLSAIGNATGVLLTGTVVGLVYAYLVRFLAVGFNTVEASLSKVTPSMEGAARTLGFAPLATLRRVHVPVMRGSLLTAALLVFVDVLKELPATLIMRPFNFDTLAVQAFQAASDERLGDAAAPALAIVVVGIVPVVLLSRAIARSRPGSAS
ncbi:MAG: iron ABC transporter permease, partial [Alphaproteobacteria bacterium]|nr:iron ABC transporter permease [Alphaproteobacteria bacterium]